MPKQNLTQVEYKKLLQRLRLQRETLKRHEETWLQAVNGALGRNFTVALYAESNLTNELKSLAAVPDEPTETEALVSQGFVDELAKAVYGA